MDPIEGLEQAWDQGSDLLAALRPGDLEAPTPCAGSDVRTVVNHVLGEALMMTEANRGETGSNERGRPGRTERRAHRLADDRKGERLLMAGARARRRPGLRLWHIPGHGRRRDQPGRGARPQLGHRTSHRQACELDPELSAIVFGLYSAMPLERLRADGVFGPEIPVPDDAPIGDRLLGLLGRQPVTVNGTTAPAIARAAESETLRLGSGTLHLLLDASSTGGALSAHRVQLSEGQLGANPHVHTRTSELSSCWTGASTCWPATTF